MSQSFCPECGGAFFYDSSAKRYICKSCGLYVTKDELTNIRSQNRSGEDDRRKKKRQQDEYLEWWLSKK